MSVFCSKAQIQIWLVSRLDDRPSFSNAKTMNKKLILSVVLCFLFTGGAYAQSGSKNAGSSSKSAGSSSRSGSSSRTDRETQRAKEKLVSQMTRKDFESVRLTRDQKQTLAQMVDAKYSMIVQIDSKIANAIPSDQVKKLKRAFREAKKEGSSEVEAMSKSMEMIGLPEDVREKVLAMNDSKESVKEAIRTSVAQSFDQEQQQAFAAAMAAKKEMMAKEEMAAKEEMMDKEKEMTGKEEMSEKEMAGEKEMTSEKKMMEKEEMAGKEVASGGSGTSSGSGSKSK